MAFLRLHLNNLRNNKGNKRVDPPAIQLQLKWRNGAWHFFNVWFYEPVESFPSLEDAELFVQEHRINHFAIEGVGVVK